MSPCSSSRSLGASSSSASMVTIRLSPNGPAWSCGIWARNKGGSSTRLVSQSAGTSTTTRSSSRPGITTSTVVSSDVMRSAPPGSVRRWWCEGLSAQDPVYGRISQSAARDPAGDATDDSSDHAADRRARAGEDGADHGAGCGAALGTRPRAGGGARHDPLPRAEAGVAGVLGPAVGEGEPAGQDVAGRAQVLARRPQSVGIAQPGDDRVLAAVREDLPRALEHLLGRGAGSAEGEVAGRVREAGERILERPAEGEEVAEPLPDLPRALGRADVLLLGMVGEFAGQCPQSLDRLGDQGAVGPAPLAAEVL